MMFNSSYYIHINIEYLWLNYLFGKFSMVDQINIQQHGAILITDKEIPLKVLSLDARLPIFENFVNNQFFTNFLRVYNALYFFLK